MKFNSQIHYAEVKIIFKGRFYLHKKRAISRLVCSLVLSLPFQLVLKFGYFSDGWTIVLLKMGNNFIY